jgi:hypothetical protein
MDFLANIIAGAITGNCFEKNPKGPLICEVYE